MCGYISTKTLFFIILILLVMVMYFVRLDFVNVYSYQEPQPKNDTIDINRTVSILLLVNFKYICLSKLYADNHRFNCGYVSWP